MNSASSSRPPALTPKFKLWLSSECVEGVFGDGKWRLLEAVAREGSLKAAAEKLGMSYRKAWGDLRKAEISLDTFLITKRRGGVAGGGAELTEAGKQWLAAYRRFRADVQKAVQEAFQARLAPLKKWAALISIIVLALGLLPCPVRAEEISGKIIVFHAGSLAVPFRQAAEEFTKLYPDIQVIREAAGSRDCARKITDLNLPCDVLATSDYAVIELMLVPDHAEWVIPFATNEMVIAYLDASRRASEITDKNWHEILSDGNVVFGRSDPDSDPCGYRSVFTLMLAEQYYGRQDLTEKLLKKDQQYIRPKETDLIALLETGAVDYIFIYRSVAAQHGLRYLRLPDAVNLGNPALRDTYARVSMELSGPEPGTKVTQACEPIVYGVTIPRNAPNPKAAMAFMRFLLTVDEGMAIIRENGQDSAVPSPTRTYDKIPDALKPFARKG